jgi:MFS family permease
MAFFRDLAALLRFAGFRRLFAVRLLSQGSDGIFQVALASTVLFSPERAPTAVAFAAILLSFIILGPFVGVFLDRWSRRRILMASNAIRLILLLAIALLVARDNVGWLFYLLVLLAFSVNRFLLAGLSASLPHVVRRALLVTANGVSPTCGTLAYLCGLGFGGAVHAVWHSDGIVMVVGAVSYFLSALLAWRLPSLGPDLEEIDSAVRQALNNVVRGLQDAARHLPPLGRLALGVVGAGQLPYGVMIVGTILLIRNYLERGNVGAGLAGFGVAVGASGLGLAVAALHGCNQSVQDAALGMQVSAFAQRAGLSPSAQNGAQPTTCDVAGTGSSRVIRPAGLESRRRSRGLRSASLGASRADPGPQPGPRYGSFRWWRDGRDPGRHLP